MKKVILAAFAALGLIGTATIASASCTHCGGGGYNATPSDNTGYFNYAAGGNALNQGAADGELTIVTSMSTKDVYGGGDAWAAGTGQQAGANSYSGSHFATQGSSLAISGGFGPSIAGTSEMGQVLGGGSANAGTTWMPNP